MTSKKKVVKGETYYRRQYEYTGLPDLEKVTVHGVFDLADGSRSVCFSARFMSKEWRTEEDFLKHCAI